MLIKCFELGHLSIDSVSQIHKWLFYLNCVLSLPVEKTPPPLILQYNFHQPQGDLYWLKWNNAMEPHL